MSFALLRLQRQFASKRVLVLGEAMLDSYVLGASTRNCQEAPAPVVAVHERHDCAGGAANTAVNLAALGCRVDLLSVIGADHEGDRLHALLRSHGVDTSMLTATETRQTISKQRILNDGRLLARVDCGDTGLIPRHVEQRLLWHLDVAFARADAIVISDYGYGVVTPAVLGRLRRLQERFRQLVTVDARNLARYRTLGVTVVKPNYGEALRLAGMAPSPAEMSRVAVAADLSRTVLDACGARIAAITLDADGAIVLERGHAPYRTFTVTTDQARTVGAGDTYLAAFTLALASDASTPEAAELAAHAASVVVSRDGTATCTGEDLRDEIKRAAGISPTRRQVPTLAGSSADRATFGKEDDQNNSADLGHRQASPLHQA